MKNKESYPLAQDLDHAIAILKSGGCTAIFLFGSAVQGTRTPESDLDIAVEGCPKGQFFSLYSRLYMEIDTLVDLVDLDTPGDPFVESLKARGRLYRVG
jgi:predicted nucleotidyltransferase